MGAARYQFFTRGAGVEWRLISANNRELGRTPAGFAALEECVAAVTWLQRHAADVAEAVSQERSGRWRWSIAHGDTTVAVSSRSYLRRVEAEATLHQFRAWAGTAAAPAQLRVFRSTARAVAAPPEPAAAAPRIPAQPAPGAAMDRRVIVLSDARSTAAAS